MKEKTYKYLGFTLIEVLVSVTILSVIMVSVFTIYISTSDINLKTDITRALQQNVKTSIERLSEDIRKNGYLDVKNKGETDDLIQVEGLDTQTGTFLRTTLGTYYLGVEVSGHLDNDFCSKLENSCTLLFNNKPIMNSWVDVKKLEFRVTNHGVKKVTILMTLQPAIGKGIRPDIIKNNRFHFQTTISERANLN